MAAPTTNPPTTPAPAGATTNPRPQPAWVRLVVAVTVITAGADIAAMVLQRSIIPPVLFGALLSLAALPLVHWRPRAGLITLAVITVFLLATGAPFAALPLEHPDSPIGFTHSAAYLIGRTILLLVVFGALLSHSSRAAHLAAITALAFAVAIVVTTTVATLTRPTPVPNEGDVPLAMRAFDFPDDTSAPAGATLYVDNQDTVWHRLTIPGTDLALDVAANSGARVPLDLTPGDYVLYCDITGHEDMVGHLTVTEP